MSKTKEESAREYAEKLMQEGGWQRVNLEKSFIAGYDSAISQASEGFSEWDTEYHNELCHGLQIMSARKARIASRLSAQKEKDALEEKLKLAIEALNYYSAKKDSGAHARDALEEIRAKHNLDKVEG